ncbi:hypothetical protein Pfo_026889 [Paulownia fortunei]|nr:hypothetical protein Pfo_026889 [Paulownia fortunei]
MAMDHRLPNDDVVTEILSHLPVQSLLRFKTVSKSWHNIIDSSSFAKLHVRNYCNNNDNNDSVFLRFFYGKTENWELSIMFPDCGKLYGEFPDIQEFLKNNIKIGSPRVFGPVNGLICIHDKPRFSNFGAQYGPSSWREPIALCNPSLGKIEILPISPISCSFRDFCSAFSCDIGFGFDYVTNDYKIVQLLSCYCVEGSENDHHIHVQVYSRITNTWRKWGGEPFNKNMYVIKKPITSSYKNGSFVHWLARKYMRDYQGKVVLSFDMHDEVFHTTLLPRLTYDVEYKRKLVKIKIFAKVDSLVLFVYPLLGEFGGGRRWVDRWVLHGLGNKGRWTRLSSIGPFPEIPKPVALWRSYGVVLKYSCVQNKLVFYDCCTQEVRDFESHDNEYWLKVVEYKGSLISLSM